jgi:hypothetical protein
MKKKGGNITFCHACSCSLPVPAPYQFANGMGKDDYNYKIENHVQSVGDCCTTQARCVRERPVLLASELVRYASSIDIDSTRIAKIMAPSAISFNLHYVRARVLLRVSKSKRPYVFSS